MVFHWGVLGHDLTLNPVIAARAAAMDFPGFGHDESRVMHRQQFAVAQTCSLPYRGLAIRKALKDSPRSKRTVTQPNAIRRYSRVQLCATDISRTRSFTAGNPDFSSITSRRRIGDCIPTG